jgi:hypothetical protein
MADVKISEMTEATSVADADLFTIVQGGVNKKVTKANLGIAATMEVAQEAGSTAPNATTNTKRLFLDTEKNDLLSAIDDAGTITVIDEFVDEIQTTAANLESNYPAADHESIFAIVNGATSDNGGYYSNGSSWIKQWDDSGDPEDLPSWAGGISYLTVDHMDDAGTLSGRNEDDDADVTPDIGALTDVNDGSGTSYTRMPSRPSMWYNMLTVGVNAQGQFKVTCRSNNVSSQVRAFQIFGRMSNGDITYLEAKSATDSDGGATVTISNGKDTNTLIESDSSTIGHTVTVNTLNTTAYDGYGVLLMTRQDESASTSVGIARFQSFETVDNTALITPNSEIKQLHAGYSKSTEGTAITADTTLTNDDYIIEVDSSGGAFTQTLPAVGDVVTGKRYAFKKVGAGTNAVTLDGDGSETIDGATTNATALVNQYDYIEIYNNGTEWIVIGQNP